jgi:hypothetical protein
MGNSSGCEGTLPWWTAATILLRISIPFQHLQGAAIIFPKPSNAFLIGDQDVGVNICNPYVFPADIDNVFNLV